uniref:Procollagen-proline 4-dioxygenase n=1 Tax=Skeletonema marinoi TaxID=267567 RepID=A0A7S2PAV0_9STRA
MTVIRLRTGPVAALLLCVCIFSSSATAASAAAADDSVCTANDTREECSAAPLDNESSSDDDEDDDEFPATCVDEHDDCKMWSDSGECDANPNYMLTHCRRSCKVCGIIDSNDFGKPQQIPRSNDFEAVKEIVRQSTEYMKRINEDEKYEAVRNKCLNQHPDCSLWALGSGCDDNPSYMKQHCAPACQSCDHILRLDEKCRPGPDAKNAIENGGLDVLFQTIIDGAKESGYDPMVWSRPTKMPDDDGYSKPCEEDVTNPCNVPDGPWVVTLENFISEKEVDTLKGWGSKLGYQRSQAGDQIIDVRTSSQAWCTARCYDDPVVAELRTRIHDLTQIPEANSEYLQLLQYGEGQYYKQHNDFIEKHVDQLHGPRLLTFFIYFNEVEEGGGTRFPELNNLTIQPKQGRVLIWPSVLDEDVNAQDERTDHEALAVERGEKYAANAWLHLRDFQTGFNMGCDS